MSSGLALTDTWYSLTVVGVGEGIGMGVGVGLGGGVGVAMAIGYVALACRGGDSESVTVIATL